MKGMGDTILTGCVLGLIGRDFGDKTLVVFL